MAEIKPVTPIGDPIDHRRITPRRSLRKTASDVATAGRVALAVRGSGLAGEASRCAAGHFVSSLFRPKPRPHPQASGRTGHAPFFRSLEGVGRSSVCESRVLLGAELDLAVDDGRLVDGQSQVLPRSKAGSNRFEAGGPCRCVSNTADFVFLRRT